MKNVLSNLLFALLLVSAISFVSCGEAADAAENAAETAGEAIENAAEAAGEAAENAAEAVSDAAENAAEKAEEMVEGAKDAIDKSGAEYTSAYVCPMHCKGSGAAEAGKCPACKMDYVANADHANDGHDHGHDHSHGDHDGHNH